MLGNFSYILSSADFFLILPIPGIPSECQTVDPLQFNPNVLSGLIWIQVVSRQRVLKVTLCVYWGVIEAYMFTRLNMVTDIILRGIKRDF